MQKVWPFFSQYQHAKASKQNTGGHDMSHNVRFKKFKHRLKHRHSASGLGFHLRKVTSSSIWAEASTRAPGKSIKMPKALIPIFQDLDFTWFHNREIKSMSGLTKQRVRPSTRCKESKRYAEKGNLFWERNVNYPLVVVHQNNAGQCEPSNIPFIPHSIHFNLKHITPEKFNTSCCSDEIYHFRATWGWTQQRGWSGSPP